MYIEVCIYKHVFDFNGQKIEIESATVNSDIVWQRYCTKNNIELGGTPESEIFSTDKTTAIEVSL